MSRAWLEGRKLYEVGSKPWGARKILILEWLHFDVESIYDIWNSKGEKIMRLRIPDQSWQGREPSFWGDENLSDA